VTERTIFITGGGGFIGRQIVARHLAREGVTLYLLEHRRFAERLRRFVRTAVPDDAARRATVVEGDITQPGLGLDKETAAAIRGSMTHALHLAAVYDLGVPAAVAQRINVDGTRHVLDFVESAPRLVRFGHVSTCAVSGTFAGTFTEDDFDKGQTFGNHYEETKHLSEKLVRERRDAIPTVIFRPGYVVGDSKTGAFDKLDGPYFALRLIARNLHWVVPDAPDAFCNAPPVDYVADACVCLLEDADSTGRVFHLTDPEPLSYNEFFDAACAAWGKTKPLLRLPLSMIGPLFRLGLVAKVYGMPYYVLVYSGLRVRYDAKQAVAALARYGIRCPRASEYLPALVAWFKEHYRDEDIRKGELYREIAS